MSSSFSYFTPLRGVIGGICIGLAASILLLGNGSIFGCSGITSSLYLHPLKTTFEQSQKWKLVFMASFFFASSVLSIPYSENFSFVNDPRLFSDEFIPLPSIAAYIIGGFGVGFGTCLGSGCTTGHGVCGMARLSKRSIAAVITFMLVACITAMVTGPNTSFAHAFNWLRTPLKQPIFSPRQLVWLGWIFSGVLSFWTIYALVQKARGASEEELTPEDETKNYGAASSNKIAVPNGSAEDQSDSMSATNTPSDDFKANDPPVVLQNNETSPKQWKTYGFAVLSAILFSVGLAVSGMNLQSKNFGFLNLTLIPSGAWDPTLLTVMAAAVVTSWISYQFVSGYNMLPFTKTIDRPLACGQFDIPSRTAIDWPLITGAVWFGIGWGVVGCCPGPGLFLVAAGIQPVVYCYLPAYIVGCFIANFIKQRIK